MILIDTSLVMHRCYHAMDHLSTSKGVSTGMEYGALKLLKGLRKRLNASDSQKMILCFDSYSEKKKKDSLYKANRKVKSEEFYKRINRLSEILKNIYYWCISQGIEADELIYSIARHTPNEVNYIYTNDSDLLQAVNENTVVVKSHASLLFFWDKAKIKAKYKVRPSMFALLKTLMGDPSDNLPKLKFFNPIFLAEIVRDSYRIYRDINADINSTIIDAVNISMQTRFSHLSMRQKQSWLSFSKNHLASNWDLIKLEKVLCTINPPIKKSIQPFLDELEIKSITDNETEF